MSSLAQIIDETVTRLAACGVDEARLLCEWVVSYRLNKPKTAIDYSLIPDDALLAALNADFKRLAEGEPVQYVIGEWDFRYLTLKTDSRALIPRPETEQLVELVLQEPAIRKRSAPSICDIGTGTGAIALSIAHELPAAQVTAIDIEEKALSLAKENCARCGLDARVRFIHGRNCADAEPASFDVIVSNPPYIPAKVVDALPRLIKDFEPRSALDGGDDGLDILRSIIHDAAIALKSDGYIFLEIGDDQGSDVEALLTDAGFVDVRIYTDFAGKTRFAKGRIE